MSTKLNENQSTRKGYNTMTTVTERATMISDEQKLAGDILRRAEQNYFDAIRTEARARQVTYDRAADALKAQRQAYAAGLTQSQIQVIRDGVQRDNQVG